MKNRNDVLKGNPDGLGVRCDWEYTRELHICNVFPSTGRLLLRRALRDWPIGFAGCPDDSTGSGGDDDPDVSFIIGHRGVERLSQLLLTLKTIAAQEGVNIECIVVEQDATPRIQASVPDWVRYIFSPVNAPVPPYNRSRAFNVGVQKASGSVLVLHDNDFLIPADYARTVTNCMEDGYQVVQPKRFLFYLTHGSTASAVQAQSLCGANECDRVVENLEGGGSIAITREAYFAIGGMDEDFVGWGGEDNEFWDRCQLLRVNPYGYLPLVHLWHPPQPRKHSKNNPGIELLRKKSTISRRERARELREKLCGGHDPCSGNKRGYHTQGSSVEFASLQVEEGS